MDADLERLVVGVYDAALDKARWPGSLAAVCDSLNAVAITIVIADEADGHRVRMALVHGIPDYAMAEYQANVQHMDPLPAYANAHPRQRLIFEHHHTPEPAISNSAFHQMLEQHTGIRYRMAGKLFAEDGVAAYATLQRTVAQGHPDAETVGRFTRLLPHLERAVRIALRIGNLELQAQAATEALQDIPTALLLLSADGRLLYA
ncbi:MAG: hypothetical protein P8124_12970, partial [Gammaproteobacteria bacterium]